MGKPVAQHWKIRFQTRGQKKHPTVAAFPRGISLVYPGWMNWQVRLGDICRLHNLGIFAPPAMKMPKHYSGIQNRQNTRQYGKTVQTEKANKKKGKKTSDEIYNYRRNMNLDHISHEEGSAL